MAPLVARAAATAREMLIDRAAARWQVDRATLRAARRALAAADGRRSPTASSREADAAGRVTATPAAPAGCGGRSRQPPSARSTDATFVTGRHQFTPDLHARA